MIRFTHVVSISLAIYYPSPQGVIIFHLHYVLLVNRKVEAGIITSDICPNEIKNHKLYMGQISKPSHKNAAAGDNRYIGPYRRVLYDRL